jgi:NitT/TauT family transport system permease protein/taurine transport system permease protein
MSISMSSTTLRRLIVISLIVLWETLPRAGLIAELFLPSLSSTIAAGWNEAGEYGHALAVALSWRAPSSAACRVRAC